MNQKIFNIITVTAMSFITVISAQELAYSGLEGITNGEVEGVNDGTGWFSGYNAQSDGNYSVDNTTPLTYGGLVTSPGGEYISGGGAYTTLGRRIDGGDGLSFDAAGYVSAPFVNGEVDQGGVLWFSALVRRNVTGSNVRIGFGSSNIQWSPPAAGELRIEDNGSDWVLGDGSTSDSTGISPVLGETNFLTLRFDMNGTSSTAHLWVNPDTSTLGGADLALGTANASLTGLDVADIAFRSVNIYLTSGDGGDIDELRFGQTYASVSPIPEPSSLVLIGLALAGFTGLRLRRKS